MKALKTIEDTGKLQQKKKQFATLKTAKQLPKEPERRQKSNASASTLRGSSVSKEGQAKKVNNLKGMVKLKNF